MDKITQNTYLVGGAVRDLLLGIESNDEDYVVVGLTPEEMIENGFKPIPAKEFPIFIKDGKEYALARTERKTGKGYKGFECYTDTNVTIQEDLARRDLTINSIAIETNGTIIDPYNGLNDLQNRILRHISEAFKEDPVRILRVARFAAKLGKFKFRIAEQTFKLMFSMVVEGELDNITVERIWKETEKALKTDKPSYYFNILGNLSGLARLFPELYNLVNVIQPIEHHPEVCTYKHTMLSIDTASKLGNNNPIINFAVLCHDFGKALSPKETLPAHHGHEEAGIPLVNQFCDRLKVPNVYRDLALKVTKYHLRCHKALDMRPAKIVNLLNDLGAFRQNGKTTLDMFLIACESDAKGRYGFEDREYPQSKYITDIYNSILEMDTSDIIEKYKGQGKVIADQIHQERIKVACRVRKDYAKPSKTAIL